MIPTLASECLTLKRCTDWMSTGESGEGAEDKRTGDKTSHPAAKSGLSSLPDEVTKPITQAAESAAELREEYEELREIETRLLRLGEARVEETVDAYRRAGRVLDRYDDTAIGSGDFASYVEFRSKFEAATTVDEDTLATDAFERANEAVDKRRLNEGDFANARDALGNVEEYLALLENRDTARETYRITRKNTKDALGELTNHINSLERTAEMSDIDLSAPAGELENLVIEYNEAVTEAFETFKRDASARELFDFLDTCQRYPLVTVDQPPRELSEYVFSRPAGKEPLPELLEYADYSPDKLQHYIDDPGALRTTVAVHQTYLDRIVVDPLTLEWPSPPAAECRYLIRELISLVSRLTDDPDPVVALRELRSLTREQRYGTLRQTAVAQTTLSDTEQVLIAAGVVGEVRARARETRQLVEDILAETARE